MAQEPSHFHGQNQSQHVVTTGNMPKPAPTQNDDFLGGLRQECAASHIPELDGIRGLAILFVLLFHLWPNTGVLARFLPFTDLGWVGVDLFFVLSGFLITGILLDDVARPDYYSRFYIRRSFRIFPLYYLFLTAVFGFLHFYHHGLELERLRENWGREIWFFVYLANFVTMFRGAFPGFNPLGPPWSLQIEEQFYLVFPTILRLFKGQIFLVLVTVSLLSLASRVFMAFYNPGNIMLQYVGTLSRMDALAFGALSACLWRMRSQQWISRVLAWIFPLSLFLFTGFYLCVGNSWSNYLTRTVGYSINAVFFASLILWTMSYKARKVTMAFRFAPLRALGKVAYGVYLLHWPIHALVKLGSGSPILGTPTRDALTSLEAIVVTIVVAALSFKYFEKPLQIWGRKLADQNGVWLSAHTPSKCHLV